MHSRVLRSAPHRHAALPLGLVLCCVWQGAHASGFQLRENDVIGLGRAFAGTAAAVDDAAVVFNNPAAMTDFRAPIVYANVTAVNLKLSFSGSGVDALGRPLSGGDGGDAGGTKAVPAIYFATPLGDRFSVGAGITAPFGFQTQYEPDWVGRYLAINSKLTSVAVTLSGAWAVNDRFSLGASVIAERTDATLSQAINFGAILARNPLLPPGTFLPQSADGYGKLKGHDWGYGWQLGALFKPTDADRVGFDYRSRISYTISGKAQFDVPAAAAAVFAHAPAPLFQDTGGKADLDLPASAEASWWHTLDERWSFGADLAWTKWSSLKTLTVVYANPAQPPSSEVFDWKNTVFGSLGADFRLDPAWTLRFGIAVDGSPTSVATRDPRVPDATRRWLSLGFGYRPDDHWSIDVGYTHLFVNDAHVAAVSATADRLIGSYSSRGNLLDVSGQYKF